MVKRKRKEENKQQQEKKNLKRLVKQKLGHFRYPENPHRAGRQKLEKIKKRIPLIRKPIKG